MTDPLEAAARAETARLYGDTVPEWSNERAARKALEQATAKAAARDFQKFDTVGWRRRRRSRERDIEAEETGE
jgi:hypothetical protein